ncbi:MAG: hypothetical protein ACOY3V_10025 [Pseudomonadota bacterium]
MKKHPAQCVTLIDALPNTPYRVGVYVFVTRHLLLQNVALHFDLDIYFGSRHDAGMKRLFLQLR